MSRVHSFSVAPDDKDAHELMQMVKTYCARNGVSFSYIVLEAIKKYVQEEPKLCKLTKKQD